MFGPGAYFAEASSKCDEYAREAIGDITKGGRSGRRIPIQRATLAKLDSQRVVFVYDLGIFGIRIYIYLYFGEV